MLNIKKSIFIKLVVFFAIGLFLFGYMAPNVDAYMSRNDLAGFYSDSISPTNNVSGNVTIAGRMNSYGYSEACDDLGAIPGTGRSHQGHAAPYNNEWPPRHWWNTLTDITEFQWKMVNSQGGNVGGAWKDSSFSVVQNAEPTTNESSCVPGDFKTFRYGYNFSVNPSNYGAQPGQDYRILLRARLTERINGDVWFYSPEYSFTMASQPPRIDSFEVINNPINYNSNTPLRWRSTNADYCRLQGPGTGNGNYNPDDTWRTPNLTSDTEFSIRCHGAYENSWTNWESVTVRVNSPPPLAVTISADSTNIPYNGSTTIRWSSTNATSCNNPFGGSSKSGDRSTGNLTSSQTYTMSCDGEGGQSLSRNVRVNVAAGESDLVITGGPDWSPGSITEGDRVRFSGSTRNDGVVRTDSTFAMGYILDGNLFDTEGSAALDPGESRTKTSDQWTATRGNHTIRVCTDYHNEVRNESNENNNCSTTRSFSVASLVAPSVTLSANPTSVGYNGSTTLRWTVTPNSGVDSCTASGDWGGSKNKNGGSQTLNNLTSNKTYRIQCTGPGGSSNVATANVTVGSASAPTITSFTASPSTVDYGNSTTLTWTVTPNSGVDSCTASGDWGGSKNKNGGSQTLNNLTSNKTYRLQCTGVGGNSNLATATVTVNPARGNIHVRATLNGSPYNSTVSYRLLGPATINGSSTPGNHNNQLTGSWQLQYRSGGPGGATMSSITPASTQTLTNNTTITFTMNFTSNPPSAPTSLSPNNSTCQQITLTWNDNSSNEDGFRVYRGASLGSLSEITTVGANTTSYVDTTVSGGSTYYYGVTSYNTGGESARATTGPVFVNSCAPNLALSTMVVDKVNGSNYTGQTIQNGDTLTFRVVISNSGTATAFDVYVDGTLTSNLVFAGNAKLNGSNISTSGSGQNITFNATQNLGDKGAGGSNWIVLFDATVSSSASQSVDFFKADGVIRYSLTNGGSQNQSRSVSTGLIPLRTGSAQIPNIREVAP